jgi:CheY-like chemotaxis protein
MNILYHFVVIDDDPINNLISKFTILRHSKDSDIQLFTDPELALESIKNTDGKNNRFMTAILLDINMPIMSGWEFLDAYSGLPEEIKKKYIIYMFSSSIDSSDMERADSHLLVSGFFCKPLSTNHLDTVLTSISPSHPSG